MDDTTILSILLGFVGVGFAAMAIFLGIYVFRRWKRRTVLFNIIGLDGIIRKKRIKNPQKKNKIEGKTYIYDETVALKDFWGTTIFYFQNNSEPIVFDSTEYKAKVSSTNLTGIVEDNFIKQLFSPAGLGITGAILIIVGLAVLGLYYFVAIEPTAVTLSADSENIQILASACKAALTGG